MTEQRRTGAVGQAGTLLTASLLSALLGWAALLGVAQLAGEGVYATFAVLWAAYYALAGTLAGLQHEVTRSAVAPSEPHPTGRLPVAAVGVGSLAAVLALATFPLWDDAVDGGAPVVLALAAGLLGLAGLVTLMGLLAAQRRWGGVALLLVGDALVRLVAVLVVAGADPTPTRMAVAIGCGSWTWVPGLVLLWGRAPAAAARVRVVRRRFARRAAAAMLSTGAASLLVAGFPWLLAATARESLPDSAAGILAALVLFRSPVLVLVYGVRPLILRDLLARPSAAASAVRRAWLGYAAGGAVAALGGYAAGPAVLRATFGAGFEVTRAQALALVVSAVLLAMATHGGLAFVAGDAHRRSTESWLLAVVLTVAALSLPLEVETRVVLGAILGPLAALGWQTVWLPGLGERDQSSPSENADSRSWRE